MFLLDFSSRGRDIEYITNLQERNEFGAILLIFVMNVEFPMSYFVWDVQTDITYILIVCLLYIVLWNIIIILIAIKIKQKDRYILHIRITADIYISKHSILVYLSF